MWVNIMATRYVTTFKGEIKAVRTLQHKGRVQVPKIICNELKLKDGDTIFWIKSQDGKWVLDKAY